MSGALTSLNLAGGTWQQGRPAFAQQLPPSLRSYERTRRRGRRGGIPTRIGTSTLSQGRIFFPPGRVRKSATSATSATRPVFMGDSQFCKRYM